MSAINKLSRSLRASHVEFVRYSMFRGVLLDVCAGVRLLP